MKRAVRAEELLLNAPNASAPSPVWETFLLRSVCTLAAAFGLLLSSDSTAQPCGSYGNPCYIRQEPRSTSLSEAISNGFRIGEAIRERRQRDQELQLQREQLELMRQQQLSAERVEARMRELESQNSAQRTTYQDPVSAEPNPRQQTAGEEPATSGPNPRIGYWTGVYAEFDAQSPRYRKDLVDRVLLLADIFEREGNAPSEAMALAVQKISAAWDLQSSPKSYY